MLKVTPLLLTLVCCMLAGSAAPAQSNRIPDEAELNRIGLTLIWWGQCVLDPKRDTIDHLTADEQNVYGQASSGIVTAFQGEVGRRLWSNLLGFPDQQSFPASFSNDLVLVAVGMQIYALDKQSGLLQWQLRIPDHAAAAPSLDQERIYIGTVSGSVYCYSLDSVRSLYHRGMLPLWTERAFLWRFKAPRTIVSSPIPMGDVVSFATEAGSAYGLGTHDKSLKFQFETDGRILTPLGFNEKSLFVADTRSRMYCIDQSNGRVRWVYSSGTPVEKQPRVIGRQVFVLPHREGLASLSSETGKAVWQNQLATDFVACSDTRVYASDIEGNLLVLNRETGDLVSSVNLKQFTRRVSNDRTDRIVMSTPSGVVIVLREVDSDLPAYHLHPEWRPILPEFAPEEETP